MHQILIVEVSARIGVSVSRKVTDKLSARLRSEFPNAKLVYRDLAKDKTPHLDGDTLKAIASRDSEEAQEHKPGER